MHLIISYFAYMNLFICSDKSGKPMAMLMFKLLAADHILELTSLLISVIMGSVVVFLSFFFFFCTFHQFSFLFLFFSDAFQQSVFVSNKHQTCYKFLS